MGRLSRFALFMCAAAFVTVHVTARSPSDRHRIVDLGTLTGSFGWSYAHGINAGGQIVGISTSPSGTPHAVRWDEGAITDLGTLTGSAGESAALGINARGQIVGYSTSPGGSSHAVLWSDGAITDLGTLVGAGGRSEASGINNRGQIVGWSHTTSGLAHATLWDAGNIVDLGPLGGGVSAAHAINVRGQVVGWSYTATGERAVLWEGGTPRHLGTLAGAGSGLRFSLAFGINDDGKIVGYSYSSSGASAATEAVVWENDTVTGLGMLTVPPAQSYSARSSANAINARGQIVGYSATSSGVHAVLWSGDGAITDLGTLTGAAGESLARAINDDGQIVGGSSSSSGTFHAVLWTR